MKFLKIFHNKKSSSPDLSPLNPSRTLSSRSMLSSHRSSDASMIEIQSASSPGKEMASIPSSRVEENVTPSEIVSAHDNFAHRATGEIVSADNIEHEVPRWSRPAVMASRDNFDNGVSSRPGINPKHTELAAAFRVFDRNGDGKISVTELGEVLRSLGEEISEQDLKLMVDAVDADGDGYIDLKEFIALNEAAEDVVGTEGRSEELRAAFHVFDRDNNNYISAEELHQVMIGLGQPSLTLEECHRMIDGVDADGDGFVDFAEFERMMTDNWVF